MAALAGREPAARVGGPLKLATATLVAEAHACHGRSVPDHVYQTDVAVQLAVARSHADAGLNSRCLPALPDALSTR